MARPGWALTGRCGKIFRHKEQAFFACEGLIALEDERPKCHPLERFKVIMPDDMTERAAAMERMAQPLKDGTPWQREEYRLCMRAAQDMLDSVKEAKYMGDPSDPAVRAFWARHRPAKGPKPGLSAGTNRAGYPSLPTVSRGRNTGRTTEPGKRLTAISGSPLAHKPAHRKSSTKLIIDV